MSYLSLLVALYDKDPSPRLPKGIVVKIWVHKVKVHYVGNDRPEDECKIFRNEIISHAHVTPPEIK